MISLQLGHDFPLDGFLARDPGVDVDIRHTRESLAQPIGAYVIDKRFRMICDPDKNQGRGWSPLADEFCRAYFMFKRGIYQGQPCSVRHTWIQSPTAHCF